MSLTKIPLIITLILLTLIGCKTDLANYTNLPMEEDPISTKEIVTELTSTEEIMKEDVASTEEVEEIHILPLDITIDDQKKVEELIYDYFGALEHKDYIKSWELMSSKYQSSYKDFEEYDNVMKNSIIESIKLTEIKGYIPPYKTKEFVTTRVPEGVPTVWFEAYLDLKLSKHDSTWEDGENLRFVIVEKEDNLWKIGGLASSP